MFKRFTENLMNKVNSATVAEGVKITPMPATLDEEVQIEYKGLLAQSGTDQVYAHIGYGSNESWFYVEDIPMQRRAGGFSCSLVPKEGVLNFCFHDGADHWDNNNGHNWSMTIHNGGTDYTFIDEDLS